jgi:hypothetical protein
MSIDNQKLAPEVLLSIHVPKTGGTTLREILLERFGKNLYLDYGYDTNIKNPSTDIRAIHTHNPYRVYDQLRNPYILTILREPLERAISHYYYWLNIPHTDDPEPHGDIYIKHFRDNRSDLETFLLSGDDWLVNIYTEHFLYPLKEPDDFWFVGFLETFNEDIVDLQKLLGLKPKTMPVLNKSKKPQKTISDVVKQEFYRLNQRDKDFYDMMLSERSRRKQSIGAWTAKSPFRSMLTIFKNRIAKISS